MNNLLEEKIKMLQEADKGGASLAPIDYALLDLWEENEKFREALKTIMYATTLPPAALNDNNEGFYRRELQRCIGDAARALAGVKDVSP